MMMSEADIQVTIKALMREHKITYAEACAFMAEYAMRGSNKVFHDIKREFQRGMVKVVDATDTLKYGFDVTRVDPYIRRVAKQEKHLNIHLEDCSDLAKQLAECKRRAGVK